MKNSFNPHTLKITLNSLNLAVLVRFLQFFNLTIYAVDKLHPKFIFKVALRRYTG